jgi:AAA+ superfamily predicted ATPase
MLGAALSAAAKGVPNRDNGSLDSWISAIRSRLGLHDLDASILNLALQCKLDQRVEKLFAYLSESCGRPSHFRVDPSLIALLLAVSAKDVAARLADEERLLASGLLYLERYGNLNVLERMTSLIMREVFPAEDLYDQLIARSRPIALPWDLFAHLGREADIAASVLHAAIAGHVSGVNILLYGPPGTGKTSFAATLAARVGALLRPVAEYGDTGGEPTRDERLSGLRLAQRLAAPGETVLLFDEAEDLFARRDGRDGEPDRVSRVFAHRLLESVSVPVIWTANNIHSLGPAVLWRMTMCLELRVPNVATRALLWQRMGDAEGVSLQDHEAARLARLVPAAPAVAATALRATRLAGGDAETARVIVEGVARAVSGGPLPAPEQAPEVTYDPTLINADCDLAALLEDLVRPDATRAVSFLLSGPPGAGKSAWVRHLAVRMGLPVLQKRASDLLNPFVGGTERNIARAFAEARDTSAILVFDEADSLLLDRTDAVRSWEISQVNEMLTWMEDHPLPFAWTTNLPERLDRASLRRFLVKIRFRWMIPAQARAAFRAYFGVEPPLELDRLGTLTPADFALARRRAALRQVDMDENALLRLLESECEGRVGGRSPVGFGRRSAA